MSAAKMEMGAEGFALLTRLFMSLKRGGRVIDVVWFQHSLEYARAVLALADESPDADAHESGRRLREILEAGGYISTARRPVRAAEPEPIPVLSDAVPDADDKNAPRRYTTTLR